MSNKQFFSFDTHWDSVSLLEQLNQESFRKSLLVLWVAPKSFWITFNTHYKCLDVSLGSYLFAETNSVAIRCLDHIWWAQTHADGDFWESILSEPFFSELRICKNCNFWSQFFCSDAPKKFSTHRNYMMWLSKMFFMTSVILSKNIWSHTTLQRKDIDANVFIWVKLPGSILLPFGPL